MRPLLPTKLSLNVTQPLFSKVVHDKVPFVGEVVANRPRLCIGCLPNLLLRMRRNGDKTICGVKFDYIRTLRAQFSIYDEKFCKLDHDVRYF